MRLHRFYIEEKLEGREKLSLSDGVVLHQLKDVFRLKTEDKVIFFDGKGMDVTFEIEMISKKEAIFVREKEEKAFMPEKRITLLMSVIKKDNFELVLQKCTEIGVTHFVPVIAERSEKKNIDIIRARKILKEASEQCGRGDVPTIGDIKMLDEVLNKEEDLLVFDGNGESFQQAPQLKSPKAHKLLIGPEGGWSEKEIALFKSKNISIYKLGSTTLRAETAAIVASAFLLV